MRRLLLGGLILTACITATAAEAPKEKQPRLKYRSNGPVCLCATGLSERDIEAAEEKRERVENQWQAPEGGPLPQNKDETTGGS